MMAESDETLLARMLKGDEAAFTELYGRRQGPVYRFALHMTRSTAVAEDITQEVFLALIQTGQRFDGSRGTVLSFLFGIARNHVLRRLERDSRMELADEIEQRAGGEDLAESLTRNETVEQVRCAVRSLPPMYREAVVLCDLEGLSYEEAAEALECPIGTVRSRLSRGREMLAEKLVMRSLRKCI